MNEDPEWRDKMIDYETRMLEKEQEAEEKGMQKGIQKGFTNATISDIKKLITALRDFGGSNEQILNRLKQDYGDQFSIRASSQSLLVHHRSYQRA